jgi:hypothetical protein
LRYPLYDIRYLKTDLPPFSFAKDNLDGSFIKPEAFSEGIDEVAMIGEVDFFGIVGDNGKGWRPAGNLGCVKEFYAPASVQ